MQRPQQGDKWWIADIAGRGMGILTQDAMVIYRLTPGEIAPWGGTYRLVGHYGERTGRKLSVKRGSSYH